MKRPLVVALLFGFGVAVPAEPEPLWITGQWSGTITADRAAVLSTSKSDEHRALLEYAVDRVEKAEIMLLAYPSGRAEVIFDDGYRPHHRNWRGMWRVEDGELIVRLRGLYSFPSNHPRAFVVKPQGDNGFMPSVPGLPAGISATLTRKRTKLEEPTWTPMRFTR